MKNDIFGEAITDYFHSKKEVIITVKSTDFEDDEIPVSYLFRNYNEMPPIEQKALQLSKGKVLDVGCGAGSHSLYLSNKNIDVTGLDTSKGAIEICKKRGISSVICKDFFDHKTTTYDTILLLMNGSGIVGKLDNFNTFFRHLKSILNPNGQVLIDSSDLIFLHENDNGEYWVDSSKGYYGEMKYQLKYNNKTSDSFDWLYVDYNTLQRAAAFNGFNCELIIEGEHYDYLAKITLDYKV